MSYNLDYASWIKQLDENLYFFYQTKFSQNSLCKSVEISGERFDNYTCVLAYEFFEVNTDITIIESLLLTFKYECES